MKCLRGGIRKNSAGAEERNSGEFRYERRFHATNCSIVGTVHGGSALHK
jgi:hypothetical protein